MKILFVLIIGIAIGLLSWQKDDQEIVNVEMVEEKKIAKEIIYPASEFKERITKKHFGQLITKQNSPIQPERFGGYHTGVDVEYEDVTGEVPVMAVCDGEIVVARWVSGYGGTVVQKCDTYFVLYGHLKISSVTSNKQINKGQQIAVLGEDKTQETDGERKHLHFGIYKNKIDLRGYVQNKNDLDGWVDPVATLDTF